VISIENLHQSNDVSVLFSELIICAIAANYQIATNRIWFCAGGVRHGAFYQVPTEISTP
jgi:hypothetical protein